MESIPILNVKNNKKSLAITLYAIVEVPMYHRTA